jgi:hypothetical protein
MDMHDQQQLELQIAEYVQAVIKSDCAPGPDELVLAKRKFNCIVICLKRNVWMR